MKESDILKAIRELDNCRVKKSPLYGFKDNKPYVSSHYNDGWIWFDGSYHKDPPNYLSLDIIRGLEKRLLGGNLDYRIEGSYWHVLMEITGANDAETPEKAIQRVIEASPIQYLEAILKCKGKWVNEQA